MTIEIGTILEQNASMIAEYTVLNRSIVATGSGTITEIDISVKVQVTGLIIAIFQEVSPNRFTARSSQAIGTLAPGIHNDVAVSLAVEAGDFIGCYYGAGELYSISVGYDDIMYVAGDETECVNIEFAALADDAIYLYGTGPEAAVGGGQGGPAALLVAQGQI